MDPYNQTVLPCNPGTFLLCNAGGFFVRYTKAYIAIYIRMLWVYSDVYVFTYRLGSILLYCLEHAWHKHIHAYIYIYIQTHTHIYMNVSIFVDVVLTEYLNLSEFRILILDSCSTVE